MPDQHAETATINRYVILTGQAKGMLDSVDAVVRVEGTDAGQTMPLRWLGVECGDGMKIEN